MFRLSSRVYASVPIVKGGGAGGGGKRAQPVGFTMRDFGLLDPFPPPSSNNAKLSIFSKGGLAWTLKYWRHVFHSTLGVGRLKWQLAKEGGFSPKSFASLAETLKHSIKQRPSHSSYQWDYQPERVNVWGVRVESSEFKVAQITVYIKSLQRLTVLQRGIPTSKEIPWNSVEDYVVFQRILSLPNDKWLLYGKLTTPPKK